MDTELVEKAKTLLNIADTSKDDILDILVEDAKEEVVNYCGMSTYDRSLNSTVIKMVMSNYSKLGSNGITKQSYSGVSEDYVDGYSSDIIKVLDRNRRVKFI